MMVLLKNADAETRGEAFFLIRAQEANDLFSLCTTFMVYLASDVGYSPEIFEAYIVDDSSYYVKSRMIAAICTSILYLIYNTYFGRTKWQMIVINILHI